MTAKRLEKQEHAKKLLQEMMTEKGRIPHKEDFEPESVSYIKSLLGPWPRALEAAGCKEITEQKIKKRKKRSEKRKLEETDEKA